MSYCLGKVFGRGQLEKIRRFVKFVIFCYIPWWLTTPISFSAPKYDQLLIKSFFEYQEVDNTLANAALTIFGKHLWYLTEELVPLSFFSSVKNSMKEAMARKMLEQKNDSVCKLRFGAGFGKPKFPTIPSNGDSDLDFHIGEDSWSFFHILQVSPTFLYKPVEHWESD